MYICSHSAKYYTLTNITTHRVFMKQEEAMCTAEPTGGLVKPECTLPAKSTLTLEPLKGTKQAGGYLFHVKQSRDSTRQPHYPQCTPVDEIIINRRSRWRALDRGKQRGYFVCASNFSFFSLHGFRFTVMDIFQVFYAALRSYFQF